MIGAALILNLMISGEVPSSNVELVFFFCIVNLFYIVCQHARQGNFPFENASQKRQRNEYFHHFYKEVQRGKCESIQAFRRTVACMIELRNW